MMQFRQFFFPKKTYSLGSIPDEIDVRDIPFDMVSSPVSLPEKYEADDIYQFNQLQNGTCVAQGMTWIKMLLDKIETGRIVVYSRRVFYHICRKFLKYTEEHGQGLPPREAAKVLTTVGLTSFIGFDDDSLPHEQYVNDIEVNEELLKEANLYRTKGFAFPDVSVEGLKQALIQKKAVAITIYIDFSRIDKDGTTWRPKKISGTHLVPLIAFASCL